MLFRSCFSAFAALIIASTAPRAVAAPAAAALPGEPAALRVMSFNVRTSGAKDGENAWPMRKDFFFETIARFQPALVGFQEVRENQHDEIEARMPEYAFSGVARDDGKRQGEWSLIGVRKDRFAILDHGDFWLSEEPTAIGSKSWDAALTRICSWVRLRDRVNNREFIYANTHFDHKGVLARRNSSGVLSAQLAKIARGLPAILTGDFNLNESDPGYAALVHCEIDGAVRWTDSYREVHPQRLPDEASFHGFKGGITGSRIDFIFHSPEFSATSSEIVRTASPDGRYPSDHYPVTAILVPVKPSDGKTASR